MPPGGSDGNRSEPDAGPADIGHRRFHRLYRRQACRRHSDRGSRRMGQEARSCRLDRPAGAGPRPVASCPGAIPPARSGDRGRRASASAAEDRAIWRCVVHRCPHGSTDRQARHLRRDASVRRRWLHRQRQARSVDFLCRRSPALGKLPAFASQRRGFRPLCHSRFHRRQLHAGARADRGRGRGDRGQGSAEADDRLRHRAALHACAAISCACATPRCRWWKSAAG